MIMAEENGIQWSTEQIDRCNAIHHLTFNGLTLSGGWCGPRAIFRILVEMPAEERALYDGSNHDEFMGLINKHIYQWRG